MDAPFPCPICGRTYALVDGDNPLGTASLRAHFDEYDCDNPLSFEVAGPEDEPSSDAESADAAPTPDGEAQ